MITVRNLKQHTWLHIVILVTTVLIAYYKIFNAGFMSWDDAGYILDNKDIQTFDTAHIGFWFTRFYIGNYHPLTMLSYAIDFMVGGKAPFIYHLTNIILHAANSVLLYVLVRRLFSMPLAALLVALLFALHPVQTETVAWVAERKNVLCGFFYLLSLVCYVSYATEDSNRKLIAVILAAIAAMLSKAAAIALPATLVALDIWLQRPLGNKRIWLEKLPFIALAFIAGIAGIQAQKQGAFLNLHPEYNFLQTTIFAGHAYIAYLGHLFMPVNLSVLYPYPKEISVVHILDCIVTAGILYTAWWGYKKRMYVLAGGIVFYTVNIALVLQFVQFGEVLMADRYLYIACIGVWVPVLYYACLAAEKYSKQTGLLSVSIAAVAVLFVMTYARNDIWLSELNFWNAIVDSFPASSVAQNSVGGVYLKMGNYPEALEHIDLAVQEDPANYKAWYNKGVVHLRKGEITKAADALDHSIAVHSYPHALFTRALLFQQALQPARAIMDIEKVLLQDATNARAYFIKASCMEQMDNYDGALYNYTKAIEYDNQEPIFYTRRGALYIKKGMNVVAITDLGNAIALKNNFAEAWYWRGIAKFNMGRDACGDLNEAKKLGNKDAIKMLMEICNTH